MVKALVGHFKHDGQGKHHLEVTLEERPEKSEGTSHVDILGEVVQVGRTANEHALMWEQA